MTSKKNRFVLGALAVLVVVVLGLFAEAILSGRSAERDAARQRFRDQAAFSAGVIGSTYGSSVAPVAKRNATLYGGTRPDQKALDLLIAPQRVVYAYVLDHDGGVLASAGQMKQASVAEAAELPSHLARVLGGEPWQLSGLSDRGVIEYATAFDGTDGRRVLVQGWPLERVGLFAGSTLAQLPKSAGRRAFVTDGTDRVLASTDREVEVGAMSPVDGNSPADDITSAGIDESDWTVILQTSNATLYDDLGSAVPWLILVALGLAGGLGVLLLRRGMQQAQQVQVTSAGLAALNLELERTNQELARSNGDLEQFASVASHDLQEPLRKVQAFGDQLERRLGDTIDEQSQDYLRRMRNASARMSTLIEDVLRFSRVTSQARPPAVVDLAHIADGVLRDLETRIEETGGKVQVGALPTVRADPTQMRQLLQNLVANALKFQAAGVTPVVRLEPAGTRAPGMVSFTVADNGIGFEPGYAERIFGVFERLHGRDAYAGTGIGLALCRKICERHGGTIVATAQPGAGATFTVTLPAAVAAPAAPVPRALSRV